MQLGAGTCRRPAPKAAGLRTQPRECSRLESIEEIAMYHQCNVCNAGIVVGLELTVLHRNLRNRFAPELMSVSIVTSHRAHYPARFRVIPIEKSRRIVNATFPTRDVRAEPRRYRLEDVSGRFARRGVDAVPQGTRTPLSHAAMARRNSRGERYFNALCGSLVVVLEGRSQM